MPREETDDMNPKKNRVVMPRPRRGAGPCSDDPVKAKATVEKRAAAVRAAEAAKDRKATAAPDSKEGGGKRGG
jgi:hypothetical protein